MVTVEQVWPERSPFRGITPRPYDQSVLWEWDWSSTPTRPVKFAELWLTQDRLSIGAVLGISKFSTDAYPRAVLCDGRLHLEDGHHRVVLLSVRGCLSADMRVIELERASEHIR